LAAELDDKVPKVTVGSGIKITQKSNIMLNNKYVT